MSIFDNFETALYTQDHNDARPLRSMMQGPCIYLRLLGLSNVGSVKRPGGLNYLKNKRDMSPFDNFETALYTQ